MTYYSISNFALAVIFLLSQDIISPDNSRMMGVIYLFFISVSAPKTCTNNVFQNARWPRCFYSTLPSFNTKLMTTVTTDFNQNISFRMF